MIGDEIMRDYDVRFFFLFLLLFIDHWSWCMLS